MKKNLIIILLLIYGSISAQQKTLFVKDLPYGTVNDSVVVWHGATKQFKHLPSTFISFKPQGYKESGIINDSLKVTLGNAATSHIEIDEDGGTSNSGYIRITPDAIGDTEITMNHADGIGIYNKSRVRFGFDALSNHIDIEPFQTTINASTLKFINQASDDGVKMLTINEDGEVNNNYFNLQELLANGGYADDGTGNNYVQFGLSNDTGKFVDFYFDDGEGNYSNFYMDANGVNFDPPIESNIEGYQFSGDLTTGDYRIIVGTNTAPAADRMFLDLDGNNRRISLGIDGLGSAVLGLRDSYSLIQNSNKSILSAGSLLGDRASNGVTAEPLNLFLSNGTLGTYQFSSGNAGAPFYRLGILNFKGITGTDKTFTFPNQSGTLALTSNLNGLLSNIVEDTTPQLGGILDTQGYAISHDDMAISFNSTYLALAAGSVGLLIHSDVENVELQNGDLIVSDGFVQAENFVDTSSRQLFPLEIADTGSELTLNNTGGLYSNMALANATTSYTLGTVYLGGKEKVLINAATEPTITGAIKIKGATFTPFSDMYMCTENNGEEVTYFFVQKAINGNPNLYQENDAAQDNTNESNSVGSGWTYNGATLIIASSVADSAHGDYALNFEAGGSNYDNAVLTFTDLEIGEEYEITVTHKSLNSASSGAGNGFVLAYIADGWLTDSLINFNNTTYTTDTLTVIPDNTTASFKFYPAEEDLGAQIWIDKIVFKKK